MKKTVWLLVITLALQIGCAASVINIKSSPEIEGEIPEAVCRHMVGAYALAISERWEVWQIAIDPTVSKHANCRYFNGERWVWYPSNLPEDFTPVLFFSSLCEYKEWFGAYGHEKEEN